MARNDLSRHLRDPKVHTRRFAEALGTGVGTTVVAPARMVPWKRRALHGLSGAIGAGATGYVVTRKDGGASRAVPAAGAAGLALVGASVLGAALDGQLERWLAGRGVRHPRVVMGVAAGLFSLATLWADDLVDRHDNGDTGGSAGGADDTPED